MASDESGDKEAKRETSAWGYSATWLDTGSGEDNASGLPCTLLVGYPAVLAARQEVGTLIDAPYAAAGTNAGKRDLPPHMLIGGLDQWKRLREKRALPVQLELTLDWKPGGESGSWNPTTDDLREIVAQLIAERAPQKGAKLDQDLLDPPSFLYRTATAAGAKAMPVQYSQDTPDAQTVFRELAGLFAWLGCRDVDEVCHLVRVVLELPHAERWRRTELSYMDDGARSVVDSIVDLDIPTVPDRDPDYEIEILDYSDMSPADRRVQRCTRRMRVMTKKGKHNVIAWFGRTTDTDDAWDPDQMRGNFQGIPPSRSLSRRKPATPSGPQSLETLFQARMSDVDQHVSLILDHLETSLLAWNRRLTLHLAKGANPHDQVDVPALQAELASIGAAIGTAEVSLRRSLYRVHHEEEFPDRGLLMETLTRLRGRLDQIQAAYSRETMRFSTLAVGVQAHTRDSQGRAFALITALVLLPSLVIGFYGTNITVLDNSSNGQPVDLALWIATASAVALMAIRGAFSSRVRVLIHLLPVAFWIAVLAAWSWSPPVPWQFWAAAIGTTAISSLLALLDYRGIFGRRTRASQGRRS